MPFNYQSDVTLMTVWAVLTAKVVTHIHKRGREQRLASAQFQNGKRSSTLGAICVLVQWKVGRKVHYVNPALSMSLQKLHVRYTGKCQSRSRKYGWEPGLLRRTRRLFQAGVAGQRKWYYADDSRLHLIWTKTWPLEHWYLQDVNLLETSSVIR